MRRAGIPPLAQTPYVRRRLLLPFYTLRNLRALYSPETSVVCRTFCRGWSLEGELDVERPPSGERVKPKEGGVVVWRIDLLLSDRTLAQGGIALG